MPSAAPPPPAAGPAQAEAEYVAHCAALRDSSAKWGEGPIYLWREADVGAKAIRTDDFARFDGDFIPGLVRMVYIVGVDGRADPRSLSTAYASRAGLDSSVRRFLRRAKFEPAVKAGQPVRSCVLQEFQFQVEHD